VDDYATMVTARRAMRLTLSLQAWKLHHGSLPKTLDELVGPDLDKLAMVDPFRRTVPLFPRGSEGSFALGTTRLLAFAVPSQRYSRQHAVLVVRRRKVRSGCNSPADETVTHKYSILDVDYGQAGTWRSPKSEFDVWESGWPFPIP